jgi:hypothetical protein
MTSVLGVNVAAESTCSAESKVASVFPPFFAKTHLRPAPAIRRRHRPARIAHWGGRAVSLLQPERRA